MGKNNSTLNQILVGLAMLNQDELSLVIQQAQTLGGSKSDSAPAVTNRAGAKNDESDLIMFYTQCCRVLKRNGLRPPSWHGFRRTPVSKGFTAKFESITRYTNKHFPNIKLRDRQRLYTIYAELIYDWMAKSPKIPQTVMVFFRNVHNVSSFMTNAFPGYASQGWLPLILKFADRSQSKEQE